MDLPSGYDRDETVPLLRRPRPPDRRPGIAMALLLAAALLASHFLLNAVSVTRAVRLKVLARLEERLGPVALGPDVSIGWLGTVHLGPLQIQVPGAPLPLLQVDSIDARPSLWGLIQLKAEPGVVRLDGVTIRTDRHGQRLLDFARQREPAAPTDSGPKTKKPHDRDLSIELRKVNVVLDAEDASTGPLTIGPLEGRVDFTSKDGNAHIDAEARVNRGRVRLGGTPAELTLEFDRAPLLPLAPLIAHGLVVSDGVLDGKVTLRRDAAKESASVQADVTLSRLTVENARLAATPVGPIEARLVGVLRADLKTRKVWAEATKVFLGPTKVELPIEASLDLGLEPTFDIDGRFGPVGLQQLIGAVPPQLQPGASMPKLDGPLRAEVRLSGPLRHPDRWNLDVRLDSAALKTACRDAAFPLRDDFSYTPKDQAGAPRTLLVGSRNPSFIPYEQLPAIVPGAVMSSEDSGFMTHNGFDFAEIQDAFATGEEGARMRGGSTLTQQLVKNLYLTRERTFARKIREAFLTLEVEAALPKTRLLELYLNIIEWGPGIYGIGEASRYYFGIDARYLDAKQAAFLASIIPNPKKFGPYFKHHPLTDVWLQRMAKVLGVMRDRGNLDAAGFEQAQTEPLNFRGG